MYRVSKVTIGILWSVEWTASVKEGSGLKDVSWLRMIFKSVNKKNSMVALAMEESGKLWNGIR